MTQGWQLAQINVGRLVAPAEDPAVADFVNALAHVIATEGLINRRFVEERCDPDEFARWEAFIREERNSPEALAFAGAALAGWARGSPLAEKWDDAAADAIEDLIIQAVKRERQSGRRRRPFSSRSGYSPF